jgi:UDP-glucuronate 4-epimerase
MKILVTGGAGFIGYHLIKNLALLDHEVVGLDNFNDYYDVELKIARVKNLGFYQDFAYGIKYTSNLNSKLSFLKLDIIEKANIESLFEKEKFDIIINLAAQAGVRYSITHPHKYIESNILGFLNILEASRITKVKHLLYASSSSVYGINNKLPFSTNDNVDFPVSIYAASKKSNELMAHVYSNLYSLPTTGLRFFTVYGPWGRPDMAYFSFTRAILNNESIDVFNNGDLYRDFTYIDDIVESVIRIAFLFNGERNENNGNPYYQLYNVGNSKPIKLMDFIEILEFNLGSKAKRNYLPMQLGDVYNTYADVSELEAKINFKPNTTFQTGIKQFVDWYLNYYKLKR